MYGVDPRNRTCGSARLMRLTARSWYGEYRKVLDRYSMPDARRSRRLRLTNGSIAGSCRRPCSCASIRSRRFVGCQPASWWTPGSLRLASLAIKTAVPLHAEERSEVSKAVEHLETSFCELSSAAGTRGPDVAVGGQQRQLRERVRELDEVNRGAHRPTLRPPSA